MTKIETKLKRKYAKELKKVASSSDFQQSWLDLLQDLTNDAESVWDYTGIRYDTVMTEKQWKDFSQHPERKAYTSKAISIRNPEKKLEYIVKLLKDTFEYYQSLKKSKYKDTLKGAFALLLDCSLNARYEIETLRMGDLFEGRSVEDRDSGRVKSTEVSKVLFEYSIYEYARFAGKDPKVLKRKLKAICDCKIPLLEEYYFTCQMDPELREDIKGVFSVMSRDNTLGFASLQIGWEVWKLFREVGLDVDGFLNFNGNPRYALVEKRLLDFQSNPEYLDELHKHFKDELPESYKEYKKKGFVTREQLLQEESVRKDYPKKLRTAEELKKMIKESEDEVFGYFPLAKGGTPRQVALNPIHPAATSRAFQSSTKNKKGNKVNVIVMTPRVSMKDEYLPVLAHEATHAMQRIVLEMGEKAGVLKKGSTELVPGGVMEDFSQLVEHQFYSTKDLPYEKKFKGKEFPNFQSALVTRVQVPYALVQLGVRRRFDELWDSGYRDALSSQHMWDLKIEFDKKIAEWINIGFNVKRSYTNSLNAFAPYNPDDGLVYMKRYVVKEKAKPSEEQQTKDTGMAAAFKKKYGKDWVKSKDARTVLLWLLLESGRNYASEKYGELIMNKSPEECLVELNEIGIKESDI